MPNDDLAQRLAELEDRILDRLDALEQHNAEHCQRCLSEAWDRKAQEILSDSLAPVRAANAERERAIAKRAERARVRVMPTDGRSVRGKQREVTDEHGRKVRRTFIVDGRGHEGPLFEIMLETDWLALLAEDEVVRACFDRGFVRIEQLTLSERVKYEREHFVLSPFTAR